jgi:hypothetical protein
MPSNRLAATPLGVEVLRHQERRDGAVAGGDGRREGGRVHAVAVEPVGQAPPDRRERRRAGVDDPTQRPRGVEAGGRVVAEQAVEEVRQVPTAVVGRRHRQLDDAFHRLSHVRSRRR